MNTDCIKCKAPMRPLPKQTSTGTIYCVKMTITGYLCECGHYNNLKRRRAKTNKEGGK